MRGVAGQTSPVCATKNGAAEEAEETVGVLEPALIKQAPLPAVGLPPAPMTGALQPSESARAMIQECDANRQRVR